MKKSIMNAKNIINNMQFVATYEAAVKAMNERSWAEEQLVLNLIFHGVEDKDLDTETEPEMVFVPNTGWQKSKPYSRKNQLKDKAKHGLKHGSKYEGYGHWDKFGMAHKLTEDMKLDLKAQMADLNEDDTYSVDEMVAELMTAQPIQFYPIGMSRVWYHYSEDFKSLEKWGALIDSFKTEMEKYISASALELYNIVDECYPEMAMSDRNKAVETVIDSMKSDLNYTLQVMMDYVVKSWKEVNFNK